ncbi:MAG: nuclear transport factor 2 family protein [Thermomonas sp.]|uniref:hypothetical protein n=1 Tax=Thermomonas sp. TaxID=1971895 RepID=UPI002606D289|nr:hypothetical protein [Thermomonas sp.]MCC7096358.1 nuclear transport factor 2 family protein [Thermomonas sp.]
MQFLGAFLVGLALLVQAPLAIAADGGSGYFRKGRVQLDLHHAIAVPSAEDDGRIYVYLTPAPLDAAQVARAFRREIRVDELLGDGSTGYVRICITPESEECGLYFSHNQPSSSFNSFGSGAFTREVTPPGRVKGRWVKAEPEDFFGEDIAYDLQFDTVLTAPAGQPLPEGGGAPGQAYRQWTAAVARGDVAALRDLVGDEDSRARLDYDEANRLAALKEFRDGTPVQPRVLRGRVEGDAATLWVEGTDRDGFVRRGRVRMQRIEGSWRYMDADLVNVQ